jgi:hypothetical protein
MHDADLQRLANLAAIVDHLELHGLARTRVHERLTRERDEMLAKATEPDPDIRHVSAFNEKRKGRS